MRPLRIARRALAPACALSMLVPGVAPAAQSFFLQANGLEGEATERGFERAIEVQEFSWGVSNASGKSSPSFQDFAVTKYVDRASPLLLESVARGQTIPTAKLTAVKGGEPPARWLRFCFTGVRVTSVSSAGSRDDDRLRENVTFSYSTIVEAYQRQLPDGSLAQTVFGGWDLVKNVQYGDPAC
jgi:type VI protein secretion system component Hcp